MSTQDCATPGVLSHQRCEELSLLQNIVTSRQQCVDWDTQNVAITAREASIHSRQGPLISNPFISSWEETWEATVAEELCFSLLGWFSAWLALGGGCWFV